MCIEFTPKEIDVLRNIKPLLNKNPEKRVDYNWIDSLTNSPSKTRIGARDVLYFIEEMQYVRKKFGLSLSGMKSIGDKFTNALLN